ncbi:hypothetical protein GC209_12550 [bacterium]|nr:hypothetical protein [bacterium]
MMRNARDLRQQHGSWQDGARAWLRRLGAVAILGLAFGAGSPVLAQSDQFAPAVTVNGTVITRYEINQRRAFLAALNQQGDQEKQAMDGLISDRLQMDEAKKLGVTVTDAEITAGMGEFAARGNLSTDDFLKAIAQNGVQPETFRDFVKAGLLWRAVLQAKFAGTIQISEAQIDRALTEGAGSGGKLQVLLSEIVLPDDGVNDRNLIVQRIKEKVKTEQDFAFQAQLYSKVDTAKAGGALGWIDRDLLPPAVGQALARIKPGEMTDAIPQQGALTLYFLRAEGQVAGDPKGAPMVDYALFQPGAGLDLARLQQSLTSCDGLYVAARGLPASALQRQTVPESTLPATLRGTVAGLDEGESALVTAANGTPALVMLCSRIPQSQVPPSRDNVRSGLVNQKVNLLAEAFMEELRSDANIVMQ